MKLAFIFAVSTFLLLTYTSSTNLGETRNSLIMPKKNQKYRTTSVFNEAVDKDGKFSFYPFLSEFVSYYGFYRKADHKKSESDNLKSQIEVLKNRLFKENVSMRELVDNKEVHNQQWLVKQMKIARILELEDLLNKDKEF